MPFIPCAKFPEIRLVIIQLVAEMRSNFEYPTVSMVANFCQFNALCILCTSNFPLYTSYTPLKSPKCNNLARKINSLISVKTNECN